MSEKDEAREWLRAKLEAGGHGVRVRLAKHLGFNRSDPITRMLNTEAGKEPRAIKAHELAKMREFFALEEAKPGVSGGRGPATRAEAIQVFDDLPPDLQQMFLAQLAAVAELAAARRRSDPPQKTDQDKP